jgi:hypothetical protein
LIEGQTSVRQARRSAFVVTVVFALIAGWQFYRGHQTVAYVLSAAALAVLLATAIPAAVLAFHRYWMGLASGLGYVNSRILLSTVYYLLLTPLGLALRVAGHDPLTRRGASQTSYWVPRTKKRQTREEFERAF